jgi:hypothetical protein
VAAALSVARGTVDSQRLRQPLACAAKGIQALPMEHTAQVYLPLSDPGVTSPVITNCRVGDASELVAEFRQMVMAVSRALVPAHA